eukprot:Nitzschia sp. Nitz4//scaffold90_size81538//73710//75283//NITZ4_005329-RA/size81538-snap-gene-0.49-mRNA-1//1//CDS//3329560041//96//frame0
MVFCYSPGSDPSSDSPSPDPAFNLTSHDVRHLKDFIPTFDRETTQEVGQLSQDLIAEAIQGLSTKERDIVADDIHGVGTRVADAEPIETPEFIDKQLHFFEEELQMVKMLEQNTPQLDALIAAEQQDLTFVQDPRLRLAFLTSRDWDIKESVASFIRYFDLKRLLFGERLLAKFVGMNDLSPKEMLQLSKGYVQVLPNRDRAGRAIIVWMNLGQEYETAESLARQFFILLPMDIETQRHGLLILSIRLESFTIKHPSSVSTNTLMARLLSDFPFRLSAYHFCLPKSPVLMSPLQALVAGVVATYSPMMRARMRFHYGSVLEWNYELMTVGIPVHLIPLTSDHKIKAKNHHDYLEMQNKAIELGQKFEVILLPSNRDLLIGKGKPIQQAPGNLFWSAFLDQLISSANPGQSSDDKPLSHADLANKVVQHIQKYKGHILSKESGVWEVVPNDFAIDKIVSMMRNRRFRNRHQG